MKVSDLRIIVDEREKKSGIPKLLDAIGIKTEITFKKQPRGYLYNIVNTSDGIWTIVPGKFSLAFSMAPEFYRRVYKQNPKKYFKTVSSSIKSNESVSNTVWMDILLKSREKNGTN